MADERGHILVVDDNRLNRLTLAVSLEKEGHQVSLAEDGMQALSLLESQVFDVVLLDIVMPEMDGYQVLGRIKADLRLRDIPVIVISAVDEIDSAVRCIEKGAEDYLPKPFNPTLLRARLNSSLGKKKLRDLEKAYLQQEMTLRQNEKLATLGKLSAGMAHELNNPAAAAQRGAAQLAETISGLQRAQAKLGSSRLTGEQWQQLLRLDELARQAASQPPDIDPLSQSDRESELESWLEGHAVADAWQAAPNLAGLASSVEELASLLDAFAPDQYPGVVEWLNCTCKVYALLEEVYQGSSRIAELVKALKAYSYMDQAPVQNVDIHKGLENTLIVLRSKLKPGITVRREYAADLPQIQAYGSELNQVWTNLIDNAIDAMQGQGELTIRTRQEGDWVAVEVIDAGPGIAPEIQGKLFDPFFTTKPPGKGSGLGLNISHNIIAQKHHGRIELASQPGNTCFKVLLPVHYSQDSDSITR